MGGLDIGSMVGGMVTSAMAPYQQHRDAMIRQHDAQGYDTQMYANRYRIMVGDLRRSGLNPMLAYMNGPGSAPSSPIGQGANFDTDPVGKGVSNYNQTRIASAQEANLNADTLKKISERENTDADTSYKLGLPEYLSIQKQMGINSAENTAQQTAKIRSEISHVEQSIELMKSQQKKNLSDIDLNQNIMLSNKYLNILRTQEAALAGVRTDQEKLQNLILDPKAKVAQDELGTQAARGEAVSKFTHGFWSMVNPFK